MPDARIADNAVRKDNTMCPGGHTLARAALLFPDVMTVDEDNSSNCNSFGRGNLNNHSLSKSAVKIPVVVRVYGLDSSFVNNLDPIVGAAPTWEGADMSWSLCTGYSHSRRLAAALRPIRTWIGALARDRRGMSAVELGLAAPVFLAALSPLIDLGLAFSQQIRVNQAVDAGAQYASANAYNGSTWSTNVQNAMTNATTLSVNPNVGAETCGCPNSTNTAIVTGSYGSPPSCTGTCPDSSSPGYYVTLTASVTYTSVMPYSILGSSTTLSSQAVVRVQ